MGSVVAVTWPAQRELAAGLAREAARPRVWPGLGRWEPGALRLIVVAGQAGLHRLSGGRAPEWGVGIAVPSARTIAIRADAPDPYGILRHELAHVALHDAVAGRVPLWFDEGYAAYAAGEWTRLDALEVNVAVVRGAVPTLPELDAALRASATTAGAAYALAVSAVLEAARRNPSGSLAPLLTRLREGQPFDAALQATTGLTADQFDEAWRQATRRRYSLLTWLLAGGGWALIALLVLAAAHWRRRADRPRRAALDAGWVIEDEPPPDELDPRRKVE